MKTILGTIISLKTDRTAIVLVERQWQHPLYKKTVKRTKKFACHYENLELKEGQKVEIIDCKPVSKTKRFKVIKVVDPSTLAHQTDARVAQDKLITSKLIKNKK